MCPIAKVMKKELRNRGIKKLNEKNLILVDESTSLFLDFIYIYIYITHTFNETNRL